MMLEAIKKFSKKRTNSPAQSLEKQIGEFKEIKQNEEGYHLK